MYPLSLPMAAMELTLRANSQRVTLVIATDGKSSDGDIAAAMAPLQYLPVHVVIRLCTDEETIVDYWNNLEKSLGTVCEERSGLVFKGWLMIC